MTVLDSEVSYSIFNEKNETPKPTNIKIRPTLLARMENPAICSTNPIAPIL